jgi:hypothetical protein
VDQDFGAGAIDDLLVFGDTQDIVGMFAIFSSAGHQTTV